MPRYEYYCEGCKNKVLVRHLSTEGPDECPKCAAKDKLEKLVSDFCTMYPKKETKKGRVGQLTKDFIKEARQDLKKQQKDLDDER